jgi:hypothetical protein
VGPFEELSLKMMVSSSCNTNRKLSHIDTHDINMSPVTSELELGGDSDLKARKSGQ